MASSSSFEDEQHDLNPHRDEDQERAARTITGQLMQRGIELAGDEDGDEAANLLSAVEAFEAAVAKRGGDSMTNAPDSNDPDYERYVVPRRKDDEGTRAYTARVLRAAQKLEA